MRNCDSVLELARELGVHRSVLYDWRDQLAPLYRAEWQKAEETGESRLEREQPQEQARPRAAQWRRGHLPW